MTTETTSAVQGLATISKSLNQASDELASQFAEIEKALSRYNLGVSASITLCKRTSRPDPAHDTVTSIEELRYDKLAGKWGLLYAHYFDLDPEGSLEVKFLRDAPRDVRIYAVPKLPELLDDLALVAEGMAIATKERIQQARELVAALNQ